MTSILILDDRDDDRRLMATILNGAGYEVIEASTGEAALELASSDRPDLIISDILMPGMNGYEFTRRLREDPAVGETTVVFSTATYVEGELRRLSDACGVSHFLEKPCDPQAVVSIVTEALGSGQDRFAPVSEREFDHEQVHVLNDKLVQKMAELERSNTERQRLIVQLLNAQEDERRSIARALHDSSIQVIATLAMRLETLSDHVNGERRRALEVIREDVQLALDGLRDLIFELEPVGLRTQGLAAGLEAQLERMRREGVEVDLQLPTSAEPEEAPRMLLFRMGREALANVSRHAGASRVEVVLTDRTENWVLVVRDDGNGFDPDAAMRVRPGHLGLPSMRERLELAGGSLRIDSEPGNGSTITMLVPALLNGAGG